MMQTFEEAEAALAPARRQELARCVLEGTETLPEALSEAEKAYLFGLSVFLEYELRSEVEKRACGQKDV